MFLRFVLIGFPLLSFAATHFEAGRVTAHRLNRSEYNYSVQDLLGVHFQPADDFPQDDSGYGFDNIGDVLSLSPLLMEHYLNAAEEVARLAVFGPSPLQATLIKFTAPRRGPAQVPVPAPGTPYDTTGLSFHSAMHKLYRFPADGEYRFTPFVEGQAPDGTDALHIGIWIDGKLAATEETGPASQGRKRVEARARVTAGDHTISVTFLKLFDGSAPPQPPAEGTDSAASKPLTTNVRVASLELGGPFDSPTGPSPESRKLVFICNQQTPGCARTIVADLARRAFRSPPAPDEIEKLTRLVIVAQQRGASFAEGVGVAIEAMLVSPDFLFRIEKDARVKKNGAYPLNDYELASRLSYFLWSSIPDEELLDCAASGKLRKPAVLEAQVRRMLDDPKSARLVENFGGQWLEIRRLESVKPDARKFPDFDDYLRYSMRRETELFFQDIIHNDRSILDFLDARYSFVNQRLAEFYGIPGVTGTEFRKVDLGDSHRGGVLTQASVLTVSSYANRTSPVLRGKWILENLLNAAPPPPPPDVPNLDEAAIGTSMSLRQQMEKHRTNPVCAGCHSMMDPLGFAMENYNGIGKWRTRDGRFPIDASGKLPDGQTFQGASGLEEILRGKAKAFARCLTEKMLTYALGRGLESYDNPTVDGIVNRVAEQQYRFSSLVMEVVKSFPFEYEKPGVVHTAGARVRESEGGE